MSRVEIVPAMLERSLKQITEKLERLRGMPAQVGAPTPRVQVDVVDGRYARHKTWPYHDPASYEKLLAEERGLPLWDEFDFEFDLMVEEPRERALEVSRSMASRIVIHAEAQGAFEALRALADLKEGENGGFVVRTGVALKPSAQPEALGSFEGLYDFVQVMGIDRSGYQGEPFDPHSIALVERLHRRYPGLPLQVDGGVSLENARRLAEAGASRLIAGSAVWEADDPQAAVAALSAEANKK